MNVDGTRFHTVELEGEVFLLDERTGGSFRIGGAGTRLWQLFCEGRSVDEAARIVSEETGEELGVVQRDAERFAVELEARGIVSR